MNRDAVGQKPPHMNVQALLHVCYRHVSYTMIALNMI
jgi:hypothetical protein